MRKIVKISWVFWIHIERYKTNYYRKLRLANSIEFVKYGYKISIGMPWAEPFVRYQCLNSYGKGVEGIEKLNKEMLQATFFKIKMPKKKYVLL